jgi:hypothetical protein
MKDTNQNHLSRTATIGVLLVIVGLLALLSNFGMFRNFGGLTGALVLGGLGVFALNQYYTRLKQLWLLTAGFVLLGAGAACITGSLGGAYFLALTGLGFLMAFREDERRWWALLPAGLFFTLGAVAASGVVFPWLNGGVLFFAGLAVTFGAVHLLPNVNKGWAVFPALGSAALAVIVLGTTGGWVMPVLFIAAGLYLLNQNGNSRYIGRGMGGAPEPQQPAEERQAGPVAGLPASGGAQEVPAGWQRPLDDGQDGSGGNGSGDDGER